MKNVENDPKRGAAQWADEVLASLDGMEHAKANPFLFTRVMARLENKTSAWEKAASFISRPAFAFATVLVFVAINASVLWLNQQEQKEALARKATTEQMLASEFSNTQTYALVEVNEDK